MDKTKLRRDGRTLNIVALEISGKVHGIKTSGGKTDPQPITLEEAELLQNSDYALFKIPGGYLTPAEVVQYSSQKVGRHAKSKK